MLTVFLRTAIIYFMLILAMRLMGKRQIGELEISDMEKGEYLIKGHLCDGAHNNVVTGKTCTGKEIEVTAEANRKVGEDGIFKHFFSLEKNAFTLYKIAKM